MKEIKGKEKNIRMMMDKTKFSIDYYQREYKWQKKHLQELIEDLTGKYLESYQDTDERTDIENYDNYFLGSIIICEKNGARYIIDGQQRLTTLTLLLIFLKNKLMNDNQKVKLSSLIFSDVYGIETFNINVEERKECMNFIFNNDAFDTSNMTESVQNILARYDEIEQLIPEEINDQSLLYFSDWLLQNVYFVEITAYTDEDAYSIFEAMNDRGLSLNPLDMLKGFLLANITEGEKRNKAVDIWKDWSKRLRELGKEENTDAFKAWLRSQYAQTIRERKRNAVPRDFDRIGTEFHRWLKDNTDLLNLSDSTCYYDFIKINMQFYLKQYLRIKKASMEPASGLMPIYYNAKMNFTMQFPLLLAPLITDDSEEIIKKKLLAVAIFLDIIIARRIWNFRSITYSTIQYSMFNIIKDIRGKSLQDLVQILVNKLNEEPISFADNDRLYLHQQNRHNIHHLLSRITDFIETSSGMKSRYADYIEKGKDGYEIEHIWANHPERHINEFPHSSDFAEYRNRIGGLLLLPKSFNASYNDLTYAKKLPYYFSQNLLVKSLHTDCYSHNPGFIRFYNENNLSFRPYKLFNKNEQDERQILYMKIAEIIWSPDSIKKIL